MAGTIELMLLARLNVMPNVQVFSSNGTWTKPGGAIWVTVEVQGGGGGASGVAATGAATVALGSSGGGGEYARGTFAASALTSSVAVTVGAAGAAGASGDNAGGTGGTSSFGSFVTAVGGSGGAAPGTASTSGNTSLGGASGGSGGTGGDFRVHGGDAGNGVIISGYAIKVNNGGSAFLGQMRRATGVAATGSTSSGFAGYNYGGGASGPWNGTSQSAQAGSAGGQGLVIVTTYFAA